MRRILHVLRVSLAAAALLCAAAARAQFPITESFTGATATGWTLLGNATLTASAAGGNLDPAGSGWLRLTSAGTDQAGTAIYNTAFPSTNGISITFDYADYGGTGADGFSFYLIDGATGTPTVGSSGGPLGYAAKYSNPTCATGPLTVSIPGVRNGYVGIGFDEYGNFSACESGVASPGRTPQSVVIRGSGTRVTAGNTQTAFRYLAGRTTASVQPGATIDGVPRTAPRKARVSIVNQRISVWMDFGAGFVSVIDGHDLSTATGQIALPATFKMGLSGSTGSATNVHEIRNVRVDLPANITLGQTVAPGTVSVGGTVTYTITITNDATNAALGSTLTDAFPAGLTGINWTATTTGGATVGRASGTGNLAETVNLPKNGTVTYTVTATVTAAAAGTTLANTVTLSPPAGVANLLTNTIATSLAVNRMGSSTALASSATPSRFGQPVTLTATVRAVAPGSGTPAGTVTFLDGGVSIGTGALDASGVATLTTSTLAVGAHALAASYGGAANFEASASSTLPQVVDQALTATSLASSADPSVAGQPVTLTATVASLAPGAGTPGGTVTFLDGATVLGSAPLGAAGVATFATSTLPVGTRALTASYGGAASFAGSTSPVLAQVVSRVTPTAVLASGTTPSRFGQAVTFTATLAPVAPGTGTPTGLVTFLDGAAVLGTGALDGAGVASFTTSGLAVGPRAITASYPGDARFLPVTSPPLTQVVDAAATTTALAAGPTPALAGEAILLVATVSPVAPGAGARTGSVTFRDGAAVLGTAPVDGAGQATFSAASLAVGPHALTATYGGDAGFLGSTSAQADVTVVPAPTTTTVASSLLTATFGDPLTFTATVAVAAPGAGTPGGTVRFSAGGLALGDALLDAAGQATLPVAGGTLPAGAHEITASYLGDAAFLGSTSAGLTQSVARAATTVAVAGPGPTVTGQAATFTATVQVPAGLRAAGGTVTFLDGATLLGTATLDGAGQATFSTATLAPGPHAISASWAGDADYAASTSPAVPHQVDPAATATALAVSPSPATFGAAVTLQATVTVTAPGAGRPGGLVTFLDGATVLGAASVDAAGQATLVGGGLATGLHDLTARYAGDGAFAASTSPPAPLTVEAAPTTLALTTSGSPSVIGEAVTLTATVTVGGAGAGTPTGSVIFREGTVPLGSAPLSGGRATLVLSSLALGGHTVVASYGGSADFGPSSGSAEQVVVQAAADVLVSAAPSPAVTGEPVTLTVHVTARPPGAGTPGGTVRLLDGAALLGTAALGPGGDATFVTAALPVGVHALTAEYDGDAAFLAGATVAPVLLVIDPAATATTLAASAPASAFTEPVTFTATVAVLAPGAGAPSGTVTFTEGTTTLGTAAVEPDGTAALTLPALPVGPHDVVATYGGDPSFALSVSDPAHHDVLDAPVAVAVSASASPSVEGQPVTFTVTVSPVAPALGPVAGSVSLRVAGMTLGPTALDAAGQATFTTALPFGTWNVVADFAGPGFAPASSAGLAHQVDPAATATTLSASPAPSVSGEAVRLTATVAVLAPGAGVPVGSVLFLDRGAPLGTGALDAAGVATLDAPLLAGSHALSASYLGDVSFLPSASADLAHQVDQGTSLTTVAAFPSPAVYGEPLTLTADVSVLPPALPFPAGLVDFTVDGLPAGSVLLGGGPAVLPVPFALDAGLHQVVASYAGSAELAGSASLPVALLVTPAPVILELAASPSPGRVGEPTVLRATATAAFGLPTGTVTFTDGGAVLATAALDPSGVAEVVVGPLPLGAHPLAASLPASANHGAASAVAGLEIERTATTTDLAAAPGAAVAGQPVTFTATVAPTSPAAGVPAGTVTFLEGSTVLGTGTLVAAGAGAQATFATPALPPGLHAVTAAFAGDGAFLASTSAPAAVAVAQATTTLALSASPAPSVFGQAVSLVAQLTVDAPGAGTPAGTVTFRDGATVLGSAGLDAGGRATLTFSAPAGGLHALSADWPGDAALLGASGTASLEVAPAPTSTVLQALPVGSAVGEPVTLVATVTSPAGPPPGAITFRDGADVLGSAPLVGGTASLVVSTLPLGAHALAADFAGSTDFAASTGASTHAVGQAAADVLLTATPSPAVAGQAVTVSVLVTPRAAGAGTPTGSVRILDGGVLVGTVPLVGGVASFTTADLPVGVHALSAEYDGDAVFVPAATVDPALVAVDPAATATALVASAATSVFTEPVTLTATVSVLAPGAGAPTGTVTFAEGATTLGSAAVQADGTAALALPVLPVGAHDFTATYGGDPSFALSVSDPVRHDVVAATAVVAVTSAPSPSVAGQPVTFTVTVMPAAPALGPVAGTVTLREGTTVLGTATLDAAGQATFTTSALPVGPHTLAADFTGPGFADATSAGVVHLIAAGASATAVAASPSPATFGQAVTLTATVGPVAPATVTPVGTVDFLVDGAAAGSAPVAGGQATLVLPAGALHGGLHQVSAAFAGSADLAGSTSPAVPLTVGPAPVTLALQALPPAPVAGQPVTLRAVASSAAGVPGGLVTFTDGVATLGAAPLDATGVATLAVGPLALGPHALAATLPANADFGAGAAATAVEVAPAASTTVLFADRSAAVAGQPVTFSVIVSAVAPGAALPTGVVTLFEGTDVLGVASLDAAGQATFTTSALPPGPHAVVATFPGDAALAGSSSAPALVAVAPASTTLVLSTSPAPSVSGQAVTLTAQVTVDAPGAGLPTGTVTFLEQGFPLGFGTLDATGRATFSTTGLVLGSHLVSATWPGDAALLGASGSTTHEVVASPTTTVVTASPATAVFGELVTLTATVAPAGGGAGGPGGFVTFFEGGRNLGFAAIDVANQATLAVRLPAGHHEVTASYAGDGVFEPSVSAQPAAVEVTRAPSQVALQPAPSPATAGQPVTLTATVTSSAGTPGGTVTFLDGATVLGVVPLDGAGLATLEVTLAAGDHALSAEASGDADHLPASGAAALAVVLPASAVTVTSSRNPSRANQPVGLLAAVTAAAGGAPATGSVQFWDDSGAAPVLLGTVVLVEGEALLTTRDLAKGTHPIRVEYLGAELLAPASGALPDGQVVLNTAPVAGAGTALSLGGAASTASAASARVALAPTPGGAPLDAAVGTVELWARAGWTDASQAGLAPTLAKLSGPTGLRWRLGVSPDRRAVEVAVGAATATLPASLDDGAWHHLALVGEATGTTLLVDGVELLSLAEPFGAAAADALELGEGFVGELDELRTWSVARTAAELADHARRPLRGDEPGLTGLWRFDEGAGLELFDAGPHGLDGAVTLVDPAATTPAAFSASTAWRRRQVASGEAMTPAAAGYDADGDPLTLAVTSPPAHGEATADQAALEVGYASDVGFGGDDALTFSLSDGEASSEYTLAIEVAAPAACTATAECGGGDVCLQGVCVPGHRVDVRAGGCGCGNAGGGAVALWSVLSLALLRRRRPTTRGAAPRRLP